MRNLAHRPETPLTPLHVRQLIVLLHANATTSTLAKSGPSLRLDPHAVGACAARGLVLKLKKTRQPGGLKTLYWLSAAGLAVAKKHAGEGEAAPPPPPEARLTRGAA